jgi:hypothetical protein
MMKNSLNIVDWHMIYYSGGGLSSSTLLAIEFPHISPTDIRIAMDVFVSMMFIEGLIKPVAIRVAKLIMNRIDKKIDVIPDWLHEE